MTLEKAIEIQTLYLKAGYQMTADDLHGAMALGNEALKWRLLMEQDYASWCGPPLPGETPPE